jgi:hypothetical protein
MQSTETCCKVYHRLHSNQTGTRPEAGALFVSAILAVHGWTAMHCQKLAPWLTLKDHADASASSGGTG